MHRFTQWLEKTLAKVDEAEHLWVEDRSGSRLLALLSIWAVGFFFQLGLGLAPPFIAAAVFVLLRVAFWQVNHADAPLLRALAATSAFSVVQYLFTFGTTASLQLIEFLPILVAVCYWAFIAVAPLHHRPPKKQRILH